MQALEINQIIQQQADSVDSYLEFLHVPDLSMGLYALPAGGTDPQSPYSEDKVYYVISGKVMLQVGDEDRAVRPGSEVYVAKDVTHRFYAIEEELKLLVFFAPAESSN